MANNKFILWLKDITINDAPLVGGKNASLGEMVNFLAPQGVQIPNGFVVTADAYRYFLQNSKVKGGKESLENFIKSTLKNLNTKNLKELSKKGKLVREAIKEAKFPIEIEKAIKTSYYQLEKLYNQKKC